MDIDYGKGKTEFGTGIQIDLTGDEVAIAINAYLTAHGVHINGPRTIRVNGELCEHGSIYVDPSGFVIKDGDKLDGRGPDGNLIPCPKCHKTDRIKLRGNSLSECLRCGTGWSPSVKEFSELCNNCGWLGEEEDLVADYYDSHTMSNPVGTCCPNCKSDLDTQNDVSEPSDDAKHLQWLHNRIVNVYGESENVDFLNRFREIIKKVK